MKQTLPNPGAKLLLLALADHAGRDGTCLVSQQALALESCQGVRTVREHLGTLEAAGLLKVEAEYRSDKSQKSNRYQLLWSEQPADSAGCNGQISPVEGGNGRNLPVGGGGQPADFATLVPSVLEPITTTPSVVSPKSEEVDPFDVAWGLYPKRAGGNPKQDARKAWAARIAAGVDPAEILDGVRRYAAYIRATDRERTEYVMQARTFFGPGERWQDDFSPPRQPARDTGPPRLHLSAAELRERVPEGVQTKTRMQVEHEERMRRRAAGGA